MPGVERLRYEEVREALRLLGEPEAPGTRAGAQRRLRDVLRASGRVEAPWTPGRPQLEPRSRDWWTPGRAHRLELLGRGWWGHGTLPPPLDWLQVRPRRRGRRRCRARRRRGARGAGDLATTERRRRWSFHDGLRVPGAIGGRGRRGRRARPCRRRALSPASRGGAHGGAVGPVGRTRSPRRCAAPGSASTTTSPWWPSKPSRRCPGPPRTRSVRGRSARCWSGRCPSAARSASSTTRRRGVGRHRPGRRPVELRRRPAARLLPSAPERTFAVDRIRARAAAALRGGAAGLGLSPEGSRST